MTDLFNTLSPAEVPLDYLDHAEIVDLTGQEHVLSADDYRAMKASRTVYYICETRLYMNGQKMADALRHEMNAIYWPWGWAE